ncbi:MAG: GyrI-like domain-containing protein [Nannocystaceae bacterium]|nr:GyrI-like domain-containing protein [bacterium]
MSHDIERTTLQPQPILYCPAQVEMAKIASVLGELLPRVFAYATQSGATMVGPPFVRYLNMAETLDIQAGLPVAPGAAATEDILLGELPGGTALTTIHIGPYDTLPTAYGALQARMKDDALRPSGAPWEVYLTDPGEVPDPADWKTQVFWPITT